MHARISTLAWRFLAVIFLLLGVLGTLLPVVPTVPFVIAAAWAGGRGWPALELWLLNHPRFGSHVRGWRTSGTVPRRAKVLAILMMTVSAVGVTLSGMPLVVKVTVPLIMALVAAWLWRRPEP